LDTGLGQSFSISAYLRDGIDLKSKKGIVAKIRGTNGAQLIGFISKERAMMDLAEGLGAKPDYWMA
jgi:cell division protein FtsX